MSEPEGVSLARLGLMARDGLQCPEGGAHHVLWPEVEIAAAEGGGEPVCQKCHRPVALIMDPRVL